MTLLLLSVTIVLLLCLRLLKHVHTETLIVAIVAFLSQTGVVIFNLLEEKVAWPWISDGLRWDRPPRVLGMGDHFVSCGGSPSCSYPPPSLSSALANTILHDSLILMHYTNWVLTWTWKGKRRKEEGEKQKNRVSVTCRWWPAWDGGNQWGWE